MGVTSHSGVSSDNDCTFGNELSRRSKPSRNTFSCEMWGDRNPPEAASAIPFYRASWSLRRFWINQLILLLFLECRSQPSLENIILNTWFLFEGDCLEQINKYQFRFGCELNSTVVFFAASKQTQVGYLPNDMIQVVKIWMKCELSRLLAEKMILENSTGTMDPCSPLLTSN